MAEEKHHHNCNEDQRQPVLVPLPRDGELGVGVGPGRRHDALPRPAKSQEDPHVAEDEDGQRDDCGHDQVRPDRVVVGVDDAVGPVLTTVVIVVLFFGSRSCKVIHGVEVRVG